MATITEKRAEATLNKVFRYPEGVLSRKDWLKLKLSSGCTCESKQVRNYAAEEKLREYIDRKKWNIPWGNECHPDTIHWMNEKKRLQEGIYKTEYLLTESEGYCFVITKTEYDYINKIQAQ